MPRFLYCVVVSVVDLSDIIDPMVDDLFPRMGGAACLWETLVFAVVGALLPVIVDQ
jgi:hypothetical protein